MPAALNMRLLELGGGTRPHPLAFASLDITNPVNTPKIDIGVEPWPLEDGSVDAIYASHVLEHIPKGRPILHAMAEAFRVLRPAGTFTAKLPVVGWSDGDVDRLAADWRVYADPTHTHLWWFPHGLLYFCQPGEPDPAECHRFPPLFAPLGPRIDARDAHRRMRAVGGPDHSWSSWWSVRGGWEGLCSLQRP